MAKAIIKVPQNGAVTVGDLSKFWEEVTVCLSVGDPAWTKLNRYFGPMSDNFKRQFQRGIGDIDRMPCGYDRKELDTATLAAFQAWARVAQECCQARVA